MDMFRKQAGECNIIITTAAIPGRSAPTLIKKEAVDKMKSGSVIVDLAAATGGNCELTKPGETYVYDDRVTIIGATDMSSRMAWQASSMWASNMQSLLELLCPKDKQKFVIDMEDQIIRGMTCVHDSTITWPPPSSVQKVRATMQSSKKDELLVVHKEKKASFFSKRIFDITTVGEVCSIIFCTVFFIVLGFFAPTSFVNQLLYFILAGFLGSYLIWNVEPALFSPLMSTSNSLSGVVILGGVLMASTDTGEQNFIAIFTRCASFRESHQKFFPLKPSGSPTNVLGCIAISVSSINVWGGFSVSYRMLNMFQKEKHT